MREIRLYGSEGGEAFNPLSLPLSLMPDSARKRRRGVNASLLLRRQVQAGAVDHMRGFHPGL